ncbi:MAG: GTP 3',8-cyclase MoaA [Eubacteriaceae bacterium]|nr:GTP 3',8-cyclase MoaA [Eubacteriaceae bacterium]
MKDRFNREINYMRVSVTDLCNLRCRYCMPEEGVEKKPHTEIMSREDIFNAVRGAAALGIDKIRLTGGEPLVKHGIIDICKGISEIEGIHELCMTTNGTLLPEYADSLKKAGVNRLNISLDTLDPKRFTEITRRGDLMDVIDGIRAADDAGFENLKVNVVLAKGVNDDEIEEFAELTRDEKLEVRFIELMPIGEGIGFNRQQFISADEVLARVPKLESLGRDEGVARIYAFPKAKGRVGLIRPVSCEFCEGCNKIRLTSDGKVKPCLHSNQEFPLMGKTQDEMQEIIKEAILSKPERRDPMDGSHPSKAGRDMNQIGG